VSFIRAAEAAREAGAGAALARAALGHAGGTFDQFGRDDTAGVALLEEALDRLPPGDSRLRAQVLARLAVLRYHGSAAPQDVVEPADTGVAIARRLDDPDALVTALGAALHARWRPGRAAERVALADELIALAETRSTLVELAEAYLWRSAALLELCRLDEATAALARYDELVEQIQSFQLLVHRDGMRTMYALLHGDFEAAAALADEVSAWGERAGPDGAQMPVLLNYHIVHRIGLLHERDGLGTLVPLAARMKREMRGLPGWRAPLAWAYVQAGRAEEARVELEELSADGFAVLPQDINFVGALTFAAHAIGQLEDAELAARAEPLLAPYRDLWVVYGIGGLTLGPVAYSLGLVQLVQGHVQAAIPTFELAIERSERMRARPYVARSRAGLAEALRRRGGPGDAARAEELSALAAADARELGMTRLLRELGLDAVRAP
jgi:tetratricopeptide (TPR) repeat protein